jgi:hypothetical protein
MPKKQGFVKLIYDLFYPGVLGSMIFDILDPLRPGWDIRIPLIAIAFAFISDYYHMMNNLKTKEKNNPKLLMLLADLAIAFLLCRSYFFYAHIIGPEGKVIPSIGTYCQKCLSYLMMAYMCIAVYEINFSHHPTPKDFIRSLIKKSVWRFFPCLICLIGVFEIGFGYSYVTDREKLHITLLITIQSSLSYLFYVFIVWRSDREPPNDTEQTADSATVLSPTNSLDSGNKEASKKEIQENEIYIATEKDDAFIEKIHKEMLQRQQMRMNLDILKISFVIALLGLGSIKVNDIASLYTSLYLAPLVALLFDFMAAGHRSAIRKNGKFLRQYSPSKLERVFEKYVSQDRGFFLRWGSFLFSMLSFPAVVILIKAVTGDYPSKIGYFVLAVLFAFHIVIFTASNYKIKKLDSQISGQ